MKLTKIAISGTGVLLALDDSGGLWWRPLSNGAAVESRWQAVRMQTPKGEPIHAVDIQCAGTWALFVLDNEGTIHSTPLHQPGGAPQTESVWTAIRSPRIGGGEVAVPTAVALPPTPPRVVPGVPVDAGDEPAGGSPDSGLTPEQLHAWRVARGIIKE